MKAAPSPKESRAMVQSQAKASRGVTTMWQNFAATHGEKAWFRIETLLVVGAVVIGISSAALSEANRAKIDDELRSNYRLRTVMVVKKDLSVGQVLDASILEEKEVLQASVTNNMVPADDSSNLNGRRLLVELKEGDPVLLTAIDSTGLDNAFASKIPAGKRLVSLEIKDKVAGNGWIKPNDHVDVVVSLDLPNRGPTSFTLLEDVTLVSVGKATVWEDGATAAGAEVGFFVTPEEVEFVNFAQKHGEFSLSLRNPKDIKQRGSSRSEMGSAGVDMTKFLDHASVQGASGGGDLPVFVRGQKEGEKK